MTWVLFIVQAGVSSAGVLLLRYAMPQVMERSTPTPPIFFFWGGVGALAYGASFLLWLYILSRTDVSYAYPVTIGLTLAFTIFGSIYILGEKVTVLQIVGIVVLLAALFLMSAGHSRSAEAGAGGPPALGS